MSASDRCRQRSGDRRAEPHETFSVDLGNPTNASIADGQELGTILHDEPQIGITDVTGYEGNRQTPSFTFTVPLSVAYDQPVTVSYATADRTATGDNGSVGKTGTITLAPGETTETITVVGNGDKKQEATETFFADLFGSSGDARIRESRSTGAILN